jgi:hypothetical protein
MRPAFVCQHLNCSHLEMSCCKPMQSDYHAPQAPTHSLKFYAPQLSWGNPRSGWGFPGGTASPGLRRARLMPHPRSRGPRKIGDFVG